MDAIQIDWPMAAAAFAPGLLLGVLLTALWFFGKISILERKNGELTAQIRAEKSALETAAAALDSRFKATAQQALSQSSELFLQLAHEKLKASQADNAHDLDKRQKAIDQMVKPVHENLKALGEALEQVKGTDKNLREDLQKLGRETARLVGALRDPAAQGRWGEYILEGLLEKSGLLKGVHYETQVSLTGAEGRQRPDAIINLQDGFHIIVDAKAPIQDITQRLSDDLNEEQYKDLMGALSRQVKSHVQKLGQKNYWEASQGSADFTVLFLPSEHLYSMALRADPGLVDLAAANNIVIASPTLLMSLLRVVGMSWKQVKLAQNAQEIAKQGGALYDKIHGFVEDMQVLGKNLRSAETSFDGAMNKLSGGRGNILARTERLKQLGAATVKSLPSELLETEELTALGQESLDRKTGT